MPDSVWRVYGRFRIHRPFIARRCPKFTYTMQVAVTDFAPWVFHSSLLLSKLPGPLPLSRVLGFFDPNQ